MSTGRGGAPTRQNLLRHRRRLGRVAKGVALLRRKREALVAELFRVARPAAGLRSAIATSAASAWPALLDALAAEGQPGIRALGWPARDVRVTVRPGSVWGIVVSEILERPPIRRSVAARALPPGAVAGAVTRAAAEFEALTEALLDAANRETLLRRLGQAVAQTSRQVNTLERRVAPDLEAGITTIRRTLDEREREEHLRLERLVRRGAAG